jgi:hypothetical protein
MLQIACVHRANRFTGEALVIDGPSAPSRFALFFLPAKDAAKTAMIVVAKPSELVERGHFQVWTDEYVENSNPRLLFNTLGESTTTVRTRLVAPPRRLSYSFISPHPLWNRCLLSSIMSRSGERRKGKR